MNPRSESTGVTRVLWAIPVLLLIPACSNTTVRFTPFIKTQLEPTNAAAVINGNIEEFRSLVDSAQLPHNSVRQRYGIFRNASQSLLKQLGSDDYVLIGRVDGGGNARSNLDSLRAAMCEKAAKSGGNAVLVFRQDIEERPFVFSTPSQMQTNAYGTATRYGNYAYANARANTTFYPGQTFAGTMHLPSGSGLVFRFVPGIETRRKKVDSLNDNDLERVLNRIETIFGDKDLTLTQVLEKVDALLADHG